ncbi:TPA: hypothetical protein RSU94_002502 [Pseudomonas aeruginosa]|nr:MULTISPECIES: hypothetical protein [Pseudomonas aeruginosa group]EIU1446618.1 hypothetical protein [Pseudomonas aeruginosa]ELH7022943.1 hypothetical protein [Pseudomonas aeruginosa]ELN2062564.1 hypothetical protein [Pseudomonas aeruginosa]ELQ3335739.1 hypothetical protein [Pseudomonas aeruginosa]MBG4759505.1 hypothetical protein [Pseudomonas aeruginosa]
MTETQARATDIVPPEDMKWLRRFAEVCEDSDAGGHDLPKAAVKRLEQLGALRSSGFGRHETTAFGAWLLTVAPAATQGGQGPDDDAFAGIFAEWWEAEGQYCRSGGGDYERTFAFQAWRHLYPLLLQARAALTRVAEATAAPSFNYCPCGYECEPEVTPRSNNLGNYFWAECQSCRKSVSAFTEIGLIQTWNAVCRTPRKPVAQAGQVPEGVRAWFEAKQAHVSAVDAYNARLKFVREHCPFGTNVDPEYQLMEKADRKARGLVGPMFDELRELLGTASAQRAGIQP